MIFGLRGHLYRSTDFGTTWKPISDNNHNTLAGGNSSEQGDIVLAGGVGTVLLSNDGGQSFRRIMMEDRLALSSGIRSGNRIVLVGQGGVKTLEDD